MPDGELLRPRTQGDIGLAPAFATWWSTVFELRGAGQSRYLSVPRPQLESFLDAFDSGQLNGALRDDLGSEPTGRRLATFADAATLAAWDEVDPTALSPVERTPAGVAIAQSRPGKVELGRPGKWLAVPLDLGTAGIPGEFAPVLEPGPVLSEPAPVLQPETPFSPVPVRPWVPAVILVAIAAGAVALGAFIANSGEVPAESPSPTLSVIPASATSTEAQGVTRTPSATLVSTPAPTSTTTSVPTATQVLGAAATSTSSTATSPPATPAASATPAGIATSTPSVLATPTATRPPTETPVPTPRPTATAVTAGTLAPN